MASGRQYSIASQPDGSIVWFRSYAHGEIGNGDGFLFSKPFQRFSRWVIVGAKPAGPSIRLAFCWRHVRRGFYDPAKAKAPITMEALRQIAAFYKITRARAQQEAERLTAVMNAETLTAPRSHCDGH